MNKLKQTFRNKGRRPVFLFLEFSTSTYRLNPGEVLVLHHDGKNDPLNEHGSALNIEFIDEGASTTVVIYTHEDRMFHTDGRPAVQNHDLAQ